MRRVNFSSLGDDLGTPGVAAATALKAVRAGAGTDPGQTVQTFLPAQGDVRVVGQHHVGPVVVRQDGVGLVARHDPRVPVWPRNGST